MQWLSLDGRPITDAGLKELAALSGLRILGLGGTEVTDDGLKELAGLKDLASLWLGDTQVTDEGLRHLAGLKRLRVLVLMHTEVTGAGVRELAELKDLQSLILYHTKVTDAGLKELGRLSSLLTLSLGHTRVTDAGLKELAGLQNLRNLDLWETQVTDAGLKELGSLKNLRNLDLSGTQVTERGVAELKGVLPKLVIHYGGPTPAKDHPTRNVEWSDKPVKVEFRRAEREPAEGLTEATVVGSHLKVYLHKEVEITNADIAEAKPGIDPKGAYTVELHFTQAGAEKMAKLSEAHRGRPLAILVNGKVVCAPALTSIITKYAAITAADFSEEDVARIARGINGK